MLPNMFNNESLKTMGLLKRGSRFSFDLTFSQERFFSIKLLVKNLSSLTLNESSSTVSH